MFKRNISFYERKKERKKEIIAKIWTLHERVDHIKKKGKVHIMNFWKGDLLKRAHIKKEIFFIAGSW